MTKLTYDSHIHHPSHPHRLELLTAAAYPSGWFTCNGCRQQGRGPCYRCAGCQFDLHIACASKPLRIDDRSHGHLHLAFNGPYGTGGWICDVCGAAAGGNQWLYRCGSCNFDVHLECAGAARQASHAVAGRPACISSGLNHQTHVFLGHQARPPVRPSAIGFGAPSVAGAATRGLVRGIAEQAGQSLADYAMHSTGGGSFDDYGGDGGFDDFDGDGGFDDFGGDDGFDDFDF